MARWGWLSVFLVAASALVGLSLGRDGGCVGNVAMAQPASPTVPALARPGRVVEADGSIRLQDDYRGWTHLGTWYVAEGKNGERNSHQVYAEPGAVAEFRQTGKWPHGATIVK